MPTAEKEQREQVLSGGYEAFKLLADVLRKDLAALEKKTDYDSPSWQYELARDLGAKKKIYEILNLLDPVIEKE